MNLVGNAIKFTDKGHVRIEVYINQEDHDLIHIKVSDTGHGIKDVIK